MTTNRPVALVFMLSATTIFAGDGVPARASASDYPAHEGGASLTIGAIRVSADQLKKIYPAELAQKYIVMEVAVYPKDGSTVDIDSFDFVLQTGPTSETKPDTPEEVAGLWRPKYSPPSAANKANVRTTEGVVVATGKDPVTGQTRTGVGTYSGVEVSNYPDPRTTPDPTAGDRKAQETEGKLRARALPEGKTKDAVAGYLYFPKPAKMAKDAKLELIYTRDGKTISLQLP